MTHLRIASAIFALAIFILPAIAGGGLAQWDSHVGSDVRLRHCVPNAASGESESALLFVRSPDRALNNSLVDVWSLEAEDAPWEEETGRVLVTWEQGGPIEYRDSGFKRLAHYDLGGFTSNRVGDFIRTGEHDPDRLQFIVAGTVDGAMVLYDIPGNVARTYQAEAILPEGRNPVVNFRTVTFPSNLGVSPPAIGDFTGDGNMDLVFGNDEYEPEWHGLTVEGEMIARRFTADAYDRAWPARTSVLEDDRWFVYFATAHGSNMEPLKSRIYKLSLVPDETGSDMPFRFQEEWMQEFPRLVDANDLVLHDLTGDGYEEVIAPFAFRPESELTVVVLDRTGDVLYRMEKHHRGMTAVGDLNGDGINELILGHSRNLIDSDTATKGPETWITGVQWDGDGFEEIYQFLADDDYGVLRIAACDLTGDGQDEVVVAMGEFISRGGDTERREVQGKLRVLDGGGGLLWEFSLPYVRPFNLAVDDLTGDGAYELIVGTDGGFAFVVSPYAEPAREDYEQIFEALLAVEKVDEEEVERFWPLIEERHGFEVVALQSESQNLAGGFPLWLLGALVVLGGVFRARRGQ